MIRTASVLTAWRPLFCLVGLAILVNRTIAAPVIIEVRGADGAPMPFAVISSRGPGLAASPSDTVTVAVDQREKRFEPFVSTVRPGALVHFPNSDDIRHHVYSFSDAKRFELKLYQANDAPPVLLEQPGLVTLGCNIHDNMKAYILVTEDDVAAVTDANGVVAIDGEFLRAGKGTLQLWHPLGDEALQIDLDAEQRSGKEVVKVRLPFSWHDPQAPRSASSHESLLRGFGNQHAK